MQHIKKRLQSLINKKVCSCLLILGPNIKSLRLLKFGYYSIA